MSTPSASTAELASQKTSPLLEKVKPFLAPYYLVVAGVLGAITVGFVVLVTLLILVAANFNVFSLIE